MKTLFELETSVAYILIRADGVAPLITDPANFTPLYHPTNFTPLQNSPFLSINQLIPGQLVWTTATATRGLLIGIHMGQIYQDDCDAKLW